MQNRWEAETQQREAAAAKAQISKAAPPGRARDRWATPNENQTSAAEVNRPNQQQQSPCKLNQILITNVYR